MRTLSLLFAALILAAACGDPLGLPPPSIPNAIDTVSLFALSGTPVTTPSGYNIQFRAVVRTDQAAQGFDFAFDIDTAGRPVLLPTHAMGLPLGSGIQLTTVSFDSITIAPVQNYNSDSAVVVDSNSVALLHSRPLVCSFGLTAILYAKLHVLAIDTVARRIDFEILSNSNCGYRTLEPPPPAAPDSLTATAVSASQIDLTWVDNAVTEDGFRIERCAGVNCSRFAEIARVGADVDSYQNTGLTAATSYSYRVRAFNAGGTSAYSNTATDTTSATGLAASPRR
jgi:hypothetical protein